MIHRCLIAILALLCLAGPTFSQSTKPGVVSKIKDVTVYSDDTFYSAFPSTVRRGDGELLVAFRRAPDLRLFGAAGITHTDPSSQLMLVRSKDNGTSWSAPALIYAHPRGGLQDPCMLQLDDESILCSSYGWALIPQSIDKNLQRPVRQEDFIAMGGVMLRSTDTNHWTELAVPAAPDEANLDELNQPMPVCNRGAMCQGKDGRVFWAVLQEDHKTKLIGTHLMISEDRGATWKYSCPIAVDPQVVFNETSLYETPKGDLVAFTRTEGFGDHTVIVRSTDGGKSFQKWEDAGFQGHPHHAIRLPDNRVMLVYGYRHAPFGIRGRILDVECTNAATAEEFVIRDDGGSGDLGYPWATMIDDTHAMVVYYFNKDDKTRFIGGSILEIGQPAK